LCGGIDAKLDCVPQRGVKNVSRSRLRGVQPVQGFGEMVQALAGRSSRLVRALEFLFCDGAKGAAFQDLRIQPILASHRNIVPEKPFFLPTERFGGSQDLPLVPLIRNVVDQTLRAYASTSPHFLDSVGKTPISPYGSMGLSVSRWGYIDWDYIRDLDFRVFLPQQIGHLSGFKSELERTLSHELQKYGLEPVLFGKDERGQPQVQLRDVGTDAPHGFHFFLIAMKPGFLKGNPHDEGGYLPHYSYFPDGALDRHLEAANMQWSDVIELQREDYVDMFNQLSFNIFGENTGEVRKLKTPGWYLHKAFKWYATLARVRGLASLEEDLLYEYEHFEGSEAELSYLARYRYYARLAPSPLLVDDLDRDLARVASVGYARARSPLDVSVGQRVNGDRSEIVLLEVVREDFTLAARKLLAQSGVALADEGHEAPFAATVRFADHLSEPSRVRLGDSGDTVVIPSEWSLVFHDAYVRHVVKKAAEEDQVLVQKDIRQALAVVLASLLQQVQ
jgi:hypothetical protein